MEFQYFHSNFLQYLNGRFHLNLFFKHLHHLPHHSIDIHKHIKLDIHLLASHFRFMELYHLVSDSIQIFIALDLIQKLIVQPVQVYFIIILLPFHQSVELFQAYLLLIFSKKIFYLLVKDRIQGSYF